VPPALARIDSLVQASLRLARTAKTGRLVLARVAKAIDPAWVPSPWGDEIVAELEAAHEAAREALPAKKIERALRDAWDTPPTEELDELDLDPVAVTPSSQVHRGVLDGRPVAVKLLRPGLASAVRQDLVLLDGLLAPLGAAFPSVDARALLREVRARALEELDLEHEASVQRHFHRALRSHPVFVVPAPITSLAREEVLVSEWIEGAPAAHSPEADGVAARLVAFFLGAARSAGMAHADPDLEDLLVLSDGRLGIVDFGATAPVSAERLGFGLEALEAFAAGDEAGLGAALEAAGWLPADEGAAALELARHALGELVGSGPARLDTQVVIQARDRLRGREQELAALVTAGAIPPADLWPMRGAAQLFGVIARIGATGDWLELSRAALRDGWAAGVPAEAPQRGSRAAPGSIPRRPERGACVRRLPSRPAPPRGRPRTLRQAPAQPAPPAGGP
jgi:ABC1 atypical kinase-like domain